MSIFKRGIGDDAVEASNNNSSSRIVSANESTSPRDVQSRAHRRIKVFSSHRNSAGDRPSSPDAGIAARLNKINTYKLNTMQRLAAVHKISLATGSSMELEEAFHNLLHITINTLGAEIGYILQFDQEKKSFRVRSFLRCNGLPPEQGEIPLASGTVSNFVLKTGKPLLIRDIAESPQFGGRSVLGYERRSLICVPLIVRDEIIGTMAVVNKIDNTSYGSEDLKFLSTIAAQVGLSIKNAKLREDQQKAYMSIIHALVSILDASDSYTKGHSDRVTFYSVELARKINLPRHRIDIVERAAILHDIGKIGVNVFLLNKDKQLSEEEIEKLRRHPLIGMKILEPLDFLKDVSTCIGQHHERVDGSGYPFGLNGNDLLLESRILSIADAYDAMTSDRPYRSALSRAEAIKELEENAGKQHDPDLIRHFVELFDSDCLNLPASNSGVTHSTFTDIDSASDYFTAFSNHTHQFPGGGVLHAPHSCSSF